MAVRTTRSTIPLRAEVLGGALFPLRVPVPPIPPPPTILSVQQAAGFDHIYDFDFAGSPLVDKGSAAANLSLSGTWTHAAPTVTGTKGSYENLTNNSLANRLGTTSGAVDVARTSDVFWEGIWELPTTPAGPGQGSMALVGTTIVNRGHSLMVWATTGQIKLQTTGQISLITASALTAAYMLEPTYIAVWWDHSTGVFRMYHRKAGKSETVTPTAARSAGIAHVYNLWVSGDGASKETCKMKVHMFGVKRGALTAEHRNNIYEAMGI